MNQGRRAHAEVADPKSGAFGSKSAAARRLWREARLFQEQAQALLADEMVPFVEWLLLETLRELSEEERGPVSQVRVAKRTGLSEGVVSYWMAAMTEFGVVDRGPDMDGRMWRVLLTDLGKRTLQACNERLEEAGLTG